MFGEKDSASDITAPIIKKPRPLITSGLIINIILTVISFIGKSMSDKITQILAIPYDFIDKLQNGLKKIPVAGNGLAVLFSPLKVATGIPYKIFSGYSKIANIIFYILLAILIISILLKIVSRIKYKKDKNKLKDFYKTVNNRLSNLEEKVEEMTDEMAGETMNDEINTDNISNMNLFN